MYTNWRDSMPPQAPSHTSSASTSSATSTFSNMSSLLNIEPVPEYKHNTTLPWILHHILECELSSELPLRIMFSFNAGQRLPTVQEAHKWWQHEPRGKLIIEFLTAMQKNSSSSTAAHPPPDILTPISAPPGKSFGSTETAEVTIPARNDFKFDISMLPKSPTEDRRMSQGIPKEFIKKFCLNKVFLADYNAVDFNQALVGIDYLRDLECTRRTALREAAVRLGMDKDNWKEVLSDDPVAKKWVEEVQKQELAIEEQYAILFVNLRVWTMINDLQIEPFYKPSAIAMLNTLFPPSIQELPNDRINPAVLRRYRKAFLKYIAAIETTGSCVLDSFIVKMQQPGRVQSWLGTRHQIEEYLKLASMMIEEASAVDGIGFFRAHSALSTHSRENSRTSSNFSGRPMTGSSANSSFDGMHSTPPTPRTPSNSFEGTTRSKVHGRRKMSIPTESHQPHDHPSSATSIRTLDRSETSTSTTRERPQTAVSRGPSMEGTETGASQAPSGPPTDNRRSRSFLRSETPDSRHGSEAGRRSASVPRRPSTSHSRHHPSPGAPQPNPKILPFPAPHALQSDNLEFLARPYDEMEAGKPPKLKKKVSAPSFFLRGKSSISTLGTKYSKGEGNFFLGTPSLGVTRDFFERLSPSTTDVSTFAAQQKLPPKSPSSDTRSSNDSRGSYKGVGNEATKKKKLSIFAKREMPGPAPLNLQSSSFKPSSTSQENSSTLRKMASNPSLALKSPVRLKKVSSSNKLRHRASFITSSDIAEPFPTELQHHASKPQTHHIESEDSLHGRVSQAHLFRPHEFENPRSAPHVPGGRNATDIPAGRASIDAMTGRSATDIPIRGKMVGDGVFVAPMTTLIFPQTPTIMDIDEKLRRQRAGSKVTVRNEEVAEVRVG
ncbi:hypothetical protein BP6252_09443 [Coleophoma cylindrospora]|uniref:Uncharacterized protein n=1 Tax=Coleophoma cylindrospora TaxID=1849047 RepID=A0A3D8R1Z0_9HELO|nr:hypothetical protein BP6252_09443 [Coleophoma cylindrospora]